MNAISVTSMGLVDLYLEFSRDLPSPRVFREWTGIHAVGACVERRVWTQFGGLKLYPNIFTFLIGPPGVGKTVAISPMSNILRKAGAVALAPNDITKQGLLDVLALAGKATMLDSRPFDYHFLALHISELANFMSKYDSELAGLLTELFDCPPANEENKRGHDKGKLIPFPGISMLVGTATQNLGNVISNEMWGTGFMARVILVYSADNVQPKDRFAVVESNTALEEELTIGLRRLGDLKGPMIWTPEAMSLLNTFSQNQTLDAPVHNRLENYVTRRWMHLAKLCMIAGLSDERMTVEEADFDLALQWLTAAELNMTEIFKDMQTHTDGQIHEELRSTMFHIFIQSDRRPIHHSALAKWLLSRVASHQVAHIIAVALAAEYFIRVAGTFGDDAQYIPQGPKSGTIPGAM